MVVGDIRNEKVFNEILTYAIKEKAKLLLITPPCQGFSIAGRNKDKTKILTDESNFLIFKALELIDKCDFDYILIENVSRFIKTSFPYKGAFKTLTEILIDKYSVEYLVESNILNAKYYGVPQERLRAIVKLYKKNYSWL
jgi:DNA (cytosine-5)-methyltransferase 1